VTRTQTITRLNRVGCNSAANDLRRNFNDTLTPSRWRQHISVAIDRGLVSHVEALLEVSGLSLTQRQADRLTNQCLSLEWNLDAVGATRLGTISKKVRGQVIRALIASGLVDSRFEAIQVLDEHNDSPSK
jgi:hypothetical protein